MQSEPKRPPKAGVPALSPELRAANEAHITEAGLDAEVVHHQRKQRRARVRAPPPVHLIDKPTVLAITGVTFPTVWKWMRDGVFPRARIVGGKSMWVSTEVDQWLADLPTRPLKGDSLNVD
jgi:predicted DNA-binding transcriptional regulator AlpA